MCAASGVGAAFGVWSAASGADGLFRTIVGIAVSFLICAIAFREGGLFAYVKMCGAFWCVSALLGGVMTALYSLINAGGDVAPVDTDTVSGMTDIKLLLGLAAVAGIVVVSMVKMFAASAVTTGRSVEMTIVFGGESVAVESLLDSGNLLFDPMSGRPSAVVSADALGRMFDSKTLDAIKSGDILKLSETGESLKIRHRFRLIPRSTLDNRSARDKKTILIGFIPDSLILKKEGKIFARDGVVAVADVPANYFGGFGATVPTSLLS